MINRSQLAQTHHDDFTVIVNSSNYLLTIRSKTFAVNDVALSIDVDTRDCDRGQSIVFVRLKLLSNGKSYGFFVEPSDRRSLFEIIRNYSKANSLCDATTSADVDKINAIFTDVVSGLTDDRRRSIIANTVGL